MSFFYYYSTDVKLSEIKFNASLYLLYKKNVSYSVNNNKHKFSNRYRPLLMAPDVTFMALSVLLINE